jgi:hypothetical protein
MICPKRIEARDRRLAAVHEAGHKVVAHHLGVPTRGARIWRRGAPSLSGRSWGGQIGIAGALAAKLRQVAVAGAIAEAAWTGDDEPDSYDPAMMSATDWGGRGSSPGTVTGCSRPQTRCYRCCAAAAPYGLSCCARRAG